MLDSVPECFNGLSADHGFTTATDRGTDHYRYLNRVWRAFVQYLPDRYKRSLRVQRIENSLDQQQVRSAREQGTHLLNICCFDLVEGDNAKAGVIGIWRVGKRDSQRSDGARDETLPARVVPNLVG